MTMSIRYKFVNELEYSRVSLDGHMRISSSDLKRCIVRDRKLGRVTRFDLVVRNEAGVELDFIERNTTVTVARVPLFNAKTKAWWEEEVVAVAPAKDKEGSTEEQHIDEVLRQSAEMYAPKNWLNKSKKPRVKMTTGIPKAFLTPANKDAPGAKMTAQGIYMVSALEAEAYAAPTKHDLPIWAEVETAPFVSSAPKIPSELTCPVCRDLMRQAVRLPECGCAMCADCAVDSLVDDDRERCFVCATPENKPGQLIPFVMMRRNVAAFEAGTYKKKTDAAAKNSSLSTETAIKTDEAIKISTLSSPSATEIVKISELASPSNAGSMCGSSSPASSTSSIESPERSTSLSPTPMSMTVFQPVYRPAPVQTQWDVLSEFEKAMREKDVRREAERQRHVGRQREVDHYHRARAHQADRPYRSRSQNYRY